MTKGTYKDGNDVDLALARWARINATMFRTRMAMKKILSSLITTKSREGELVRLNPNIVTKVNYGRYK